MKAHLVDSILDKGLLKYTNILKSYYYVDEFIESRVIPQCRKYMTDSGAFTFFKGAQGVKWAEWLESYAAYIVRNDLDLFFELDIDLLVGYSKVKEYRRQLERMTGKQSIPVWHKSRGIDEFKRLCREYEYVSIGGIASREITRSEHKNFPLFIEYAHKHGCKIHALGFSTLSELPLYHFDSVDSTAWVSGNRFGHAYFFDGQSLQIIHKDKSQRMAGHRELTINNFIEWVKFQKYARRHL